MCPSHLNVKVSENQTVVCGSCLEEDYNYFIHQHGEKHLLCCFNYVNAVALTWQMWEARNCVVVDTSSYHQVSWSPRLMETLTGICWWGFLLVHVASAPVYK